MFNVGESRRRGPKRIPVKTHSIELSKNKLAQIIFYFQNYNSLCSDVGLTEEKKSVCDIETGPNILRYRTKWDRSVPV